MFSVWHENVQKNNFPALSGDRKTDVLIIGGGIAGVLCAYKLQERQVDYILVEADEIGGGTTKNTTAKVTAQHGLIYAKLIRRFGREKAKLYLDANIKALHMFFDLCGDIDCDFQEKDNYVYSLTNYQKLEDETAALKTLGFDAALVKDLPFAFETVGAVKFPHQAQFNPLRFLYAIAKDLNIYENTKVKELRHLTAVTNHGNITAKKIICATHFPIINKHGLYPLKMYQHRSYLIAYENAPNVNGMYVDEALKGFTFRNFGNYLLIGGGDHRTGKKGGNWNEIRCFAEKYYPYAKEKFHWAAQDCITLDEAPYIGLYAKSTPQLYVATGFNKWGFTSSMAAAEILADMVTERPNPFAKVFDPSRSILRLQLALNMFESIIGLVNFSRKRCPHLGCALKWNAAERSWDCSCHGSRFEEDGRLIDNPATDGL